VPLVYLGALVAVAVLHPFLPDWPWLVTHLLLLGAATNAILVWSNHFTAAVLRSPSPKSRKGEAARLAMLNAGVLAVLTAGPAAAPWLGVAGAAAVFAAVAAHLGSLAVRLRRALPARFAVTVHYYLAASSALLVGVPLGAVMLAADGDRSRLVLVHAHVNLLGWVGLTVIGTLVTLWPTTLRTRMAEGAAAAASAGLTPAVAGLVLLAVGLAAWWPMIAVAGLVLYAAAAGYILWPALGPARQRPPASFATWSIAASVGWLGVALIRDAWTLLHASTPEAAAAAFSELLIPLLAGFVAQVLIGALSYLLPMALGGGPAAVRERAARLDRHWPQRVAMANLALAIFQLPVGSYVRIITSMLVLVALGQFLLPAARLLLARRREPVSTPPTPPESTAAPLRPLGGIAAGVALVLLATLVGTIAQRPTTGGPFQPAAAVAPSGQTTTVDVVARGMRFQPDHITVAYGDRLIINLSNADTRRHDLVLANGARTATIPRGGTARLDAGIIGAALGGWCSLPGHRQAGMVLTVSVSGAPAGGVPGNAPPHSGADGHAAHGDAGHGDGDTGATGIDAMAEPTPGFTARDATLAPASQVRTHRVTLTIQEVDREVSPGVHQKLWTFGGTTPGPVLRGRIGDVFEITLVNDGSIEHGVDFHAGALAPDVPMRPIDPGDRLVYRFTATRAGIWMYHCSAMPMLHHIGNGMYGAVVIDPPGLPPVDREFLLVQSELYLGPPGEPGDLAKMQAERPDAVVFNGYVSQYAHRPLLARAGERIRIWVLDAGPNRAASFHIVGAVFDTVYREGSWDLRSQDAGGAQVLGLAPASGGFVETVVVQPGTYPFVSHSMVDAERGARGAFHVTR
jgi:nitrite reductase (NO-forming)